MREWPGWSLEQREQAFGDGLQLCFPLQARGSRAEIGITRLSQVGYHQFRLPFREMQAGAAREIDFPEFVLLIAAENSIVGAAAPGPVVTFLRRVLQSIANIEDVLASPNPAATVFSTRDPLFIEGEAALRFGHAVHPTPRSRDEFTLEDSQRFAAEYGNDFALRWWVAAPEAVAHGGSGAHSAPEMAAALAASDPLIGRSSCYRLGDGQALLPMHPWQASRLMLEPEVEALFRAGLVRDLGAAGAPWRATSSLRCFHAPHAAWMLKVSLSLRLTNSLRIIEPHEVQRGLEIDKLLAGPLGQALAARFPQFKVMGEPGYLALKARDGRVLSETIVAFRENPFRGDEKAAVLAALCEIAPNGHDSALGDTIRRIAARENTDATAIARRWFERFLELVVRPLLLVQADYGLLFGAHQQNIVLGLEDGWPVCLYFRDCQGTGYVREFLPDLARQAENVRLEAGHIFESAKAAQLAGYYLIANSVFAVIAALDTGGCAREADLLVLLRGCIAALAAESPRDSTCLDYLLGSPTLASKGNFMICFRNLNENTDVVDPLAGYVPIPNPIAGAAS